MGWMKVANEARGSMEVKYNGKKVASGSCFK
jgi:hypothetical protein